MNNIWNTLNAPAVPFYCVPKITFLRSFRSQNTLCALFSIQGVILEYSTFYLKFLTQNSPRYDILEFLTFLGHMTIINWRAIIVSIIALDAIIPHVTAIIERSSREEDKNGSLSQKLYYICILKTNFVSLLSKIFDI